jgi:hypothetical protein
LGLGRKEIIEGGERLLARDKPIGIGREWRRVWREDESPVSFCTTVIALGELGRSLIGAGWLL